MGNLFRCLVIAVLSASLLSCTSGTDGQSGNVPSSGLAPDIVDLMGFGWGGGTDMITDRSQYETGSKPGLENFSYIGDPYYAEDMDVEIYYDRFEFVDGGLVGAEFVGEDMADMDKIRTYLTDAYGEPQESSPGYYKWVSKTGTLVLQDSDDNWSLMGWSSDAPDYWN